MFRKTAVWKIGMRLVVGCHCVDIGKAPSRGVLDLTFEKILGHRTDIQTNFGEKTTKLRRYVKRSRTRELRIFDCDNT